MEILTPPELLDYADARPSPEGRSEALWVGWHKCALQAPQEIGGSPVGQVNQRSNNRTLNQHQHPWELVRKSNYGLPPHPHPRWAELEALGVGP